MAPATGAAAILALSVGLCATVARIGFHWDQESALLPWLMSRGWVLYRDLRDQHTPLFPWAAAFLPDPGSAGTQFALNLALLALVCGLLALVAWRTAGPFAAMVAMSVYAVWTIRFDGAHLWYDFALAPFYLVAYWLCWRTADEPLTRWRCVALGGLLGTAVLVKQHAVVALLGGLVLMGTPRAAAAYACGAFVPLILSAVAFLRLGALGDDVYWAGTFNVTSRYVETGGLGVPKSDWPLLLALLSPLLVLALGAGVRRREERRFPRFPLFAASLIVAAILPIWPRYARFHLAAALPLMSIVTGLAARNLATRLRDWREHHRLRWTAGFFLILGAVALTVPFRGRSLFAVWRTASAPLPYSTTASPLRAWVQSITTPGEPIFIYDLDPTLYRVVEREPPRPWSPLFPWILEGDSTATEWADGVEAAHPRVALVTREFVAGRHLPIPDHGRTESYVRAHYAAGPHFSVQKYPGGSSQEIVALLRSDR